MRILVTGGAGFIGSHLCERLAKDDSNEVFSLDNYSTGSRDNHVDNVTYITGYTRSINNLSDYKFDIIYHLGEYSRVEQSFKDISKVIEYNKIGTQAVLEYVRKEKCKLVYAGSSTKYGDIGSNSSPYSWSKASNTEMVKNYGEWYGIDYAITYFYNVYGPREIEKGNYSTLIAKFKKLKSEGESLPIVLPGTQQRNFTHVYDIIDGLILVGEKGYGDEYGIGNSKSYSIFEIAEMFESDYTMLPERKGNRLSAEVITKKTEDLGWKPTRNLKEYINEYL